MMVRQVLKQAFWDFYDHLGRLFFLNFVLFLVLVPLGYLALVFGLVTVSGFGPGLRLPLLLAVMTPLAALLGTFWMAGLFHFLHLSSQEKDPSWKEFLRGVRLCGGRVLRFHLAWWLIFVVLLLNVWFYFLSGLLPESLRTLGFAVGGLCFWLAVLLVVVLFHAMPLVVRRGSGIRQGLKLGLFLTLKYPGATFGTAIFGASLLVIGGALKFAGLVLFGFTLPALLANSLHDVILEREEEAEARAGEQAEKGAASWHAIRQAEDEAEEKRLRRARYDRTFRDILRPWDMG